jgi:amidohydrolase
VAASAVVLALQNIISRRVNPNDTAVITVGLIKGGSRFNVIPEECALEGTVRTFNSDITKQMPLLIENAATHAAAAYGATAKVTYESGHPSLYNDPRVTVLCRKAVADILGEKGISPVIPVPATGEDFSYYAKKVPAAFAWLGCRPANVSKEDMPPLHNAKFLPESAAQEIGVRYLAASAFRILSEFKV